MKPKTAIKTMIDALMTLTLLFLVGYQLWGDAAHEWAGVTMLTLFIVHNLLNRSWYKMLLRGKHTPLRILQTCVDLLLVALMLGQMYSGITMSKHVFVFLPIRGGMALARRLHILGAYWGFSLMSLHLGLHWAMLIGMARKHRLGQISPKRVPLSFCVSALIAAYGVYAFVKRDLLTYMLLRTEFVFMDYAETKISFYLDYIAIMGLFVFLAHYGAKLLKRHKTKKEKEKTS